MTDQDPSVQRSAGRGRIVTDVAGFAGSQYVLRFTTLLKGFIVARVMGPEGNGLWQHFVIIAEYCENCHFGALPGLSKVFGHRVGQGDEAGATAVRHTGTAAVMGAALLLWAGLVLFVVMRGDSLATHDRWGLPLLGFLVFFDQLNFSYQGILRVYGRIQLISGVNLMFAFANLIVAVSLMLKFGILGLLAGWGLTRFVTTLWMVKRSGFSLRPSIDRATLRILMLTGFPIFLFHLTRVGLRNIDRVLVDTVLEKSQLGIYGLAVTLAGLIRYVAEAVAFVIYPIFLRAFGATRDPRALTRHLVRPTELLSLLVPIVLGFSYLVLQLPIYWLLPQFVESIAIYRLLTFAMAFYCLAVLPGFYLMAIDRQNWLVPMGLGVIAFEYFVGRRLIGMGYGLPGVAVTMGAGAFAYCTAVLLYAGAFAFRSTRRLFAWVGKIYLPVALFSGVVALILRIVPRTPLGSGGEVSRAAVEGGLFLLVSVPVLLAYERRHGVLRSLRRPRS
jgi:O-antigen/teichoic acid export membrane protein